MTHLDTSDVQRVTVSALGALLVSSVFILAAVAPAEAIARPALTHIAQQAPSIEAVIQP